MSDAALPKTVDEGKTSAIIVYVLILLSLPSAWILFFIGGFVAYAVRGNAAPWIRAHLDKEIKVFWTTIWWSIGLGILAVLLTISLIGILALWLVGIAFTILLVWYHVVTLIGLIQLLQDKPV